jgi:predicted nucleic acid-binding protein
MIVVSNTSPLTNLAAIGQFGLFHQLYGRLHIAEGVWEELNARGQHWPGRDEVAAADWIERHTAKNQALVTALRRDLDRGEAETIALALELGADLVLLDEREGRHAAQRLELRVAGVVGILLEAKSRSAAGCG